MKRLIPFVMIAACAPAVTVPILVQEPVPAATADTCGGAQFAALIGQPATALEKVLILRQVRLIRPNSPTPQDLRPVRLNFVIDENEVIRQITCG